MPYFPELNGYVMDSFKKEYQDALVIKKMLEEFRAGTSPSEWLEDEEEY